MSDVDLTYPPLRPEHAVLHVCLDCGAVVPQKAIGIHDGWHKGLGAADRIYSVAEHVRAELILNAPGR